MILMSMKTAPAWLPPCLRAERLANHPALTLAATTVALLRRQAAMLALPATSAWPAAASLRGGAATPTTLARAAASPPWLALLLKAQTSTALPSPCNARTVAASTNPCATVCASKSHLESVCCSRLSFIASFALMHQLGVCVQNRMQQAPAMTLMCPRLVSAWLPRCPIAATLVCHPAPTVAATRAETHRPAG